MRIAKELVNLAELWKEDLQEEPTEETAEKLALEIAEEQFTKDELKWLHDFLCEDAYTELGLRALDESKAADFIRLVNYMLERVRNKMQVTDDADDDENEDGI